MAAPTRNSKDRLIQELANEPWRFDFFQAARLLQSWHPAGSRIGCSSSPDQDAVRFGEHPSLAFESSELEEFEPGDAQAPARLFVRFLGLLGSNGPMPLWFSAYAFDRQNLHKDSALVDFLNIFHHRLISLFFRAWACNQKAVDLDRPADAAFPDYFRSLIGLGLEASKEHDAELPDWTKIFYAGRLVPQSRGIEGLEAILQDDFGLPVAVEPFVGRWLDVNECADEPAEGFCQLGGPPGAGVLGESAIIGWCVWDRQLSIRIRIGPMTLAKYKSFLPRQAPEGRLLRRLAAWVRTYVGHEFFCEVQLVLQADEAREVRLGVEGKLGWTTWLGIEQLPFDRDPDDLLLECEL